ncbi:MAG: hypothetical protein ACKVRP_10405 [Bacteroidota bacterium]
MKVHTWLLFLFLAIPGCVTFKELEPDPPLLSGERGYIELKNDKDHFELDKDGKYFIKFPPPTKDRFYLVLTARTKPSLRAYLTSTFDDGKGPVTPIADEAASSDSLFVYPIEARVPMLYWVIDSVMQNVLLEMTYRYVPQWRYTFENKHAEYKRVLADNVVDRSLYNSIDAAFNVDVLDFNRELPYVEQRTAKLKSMNDELLQLQSVFPPDIAASKDTAYEQYVALRGKVSDELTFQDNYAAVLNLLKKEKETRGNTGAFLEAVPYFTEVVSQRDRFPAGVKAKACDVLLTRLSEVSPYLDGILRNKRDIRKVEPAPSADVVGGLYQACGQHIPLETETAIRFINRFNQEAAALESSNKKYDALRGFFEANISSPNESFYSDLLAKADEVKAALPEPRASNIDRYSSYTCAAILGREIAAAANRAADLQAVYNTARNASMQIASRDWSAAEMYVRELHETPGISASADIRLQRGLLVERLEDNLYAGVKSASEQRIDAFIQAHQMEIDNVAQLYTDSAFLPVHQLTFSSRGSNDLLNKRKQIEDYLDGIKYIQLPENSIKAIYAEFTRNMRDRGVEKARAIVEHGKFYKGSDKQVKGLITECDVQAAKWIIRPKEYRKLFALPVTNNATGVNEYMFRVRLQIPSEAEFPVFDINLKLPQEIAEKAGLEQWYESITIDKKPLKNEGRFRITSPTAETNYEALITPVQMDKAGRNVLEVRFKYPGFRVFEVSTMAQVPIIRKN